MTKMHAKTNIKLYAILNSSNYPKLRILLVLKQLLWPKMKWKIRDATDKEPEIKTRSSNRLKDYQTQ